MGGLNPAVIHLAGRSDVALSKKLFKLPHVQSGRESEMGVANNLIKKNVSQVRINLMERVLECFGIIFIMFAGTSVMEVLSSPSP